MQDFKIRFSMYCFGEPTEQDIESVEEASRLVVGDYLSPFIIDTNYGLLSDLRREELNLRDLVYLRAEAENKLLRGDLDAFY